jgi:hypothetical protein
MGPVLSGHSFCARSRRAFPMTLTEDRAIAAAAIIGDSSNPNVGKSTPAAIGIHGDVVDEREHQVLADVSHRGVGRVTCSHDPGQVALEQGYPGALDGHVRSRTHRNAYVRGGQRRSVVDAISRPRDLRRGAA